MSTISATSAGQGLAQFLKSLSGTGSTQCASSVPSDITVTQPAAQAVQGHGHHHGHGGNGAAFKKIEDAVTSALQSAQSDGSADPNQVIEDAIAKALGGGDGTAPAGTDPSTQTNPAAPDSTAGTDDGGPSRQAFFQMLKQFGVDPKQFRSDLMAAVKDAQGGQVDASTAFKSFPPGAAVDATV